MLTSEIKIGEDYYALGKRVIPVKTWVAPPMYFNRTRGKRVWQCRVFEDDGSSFLKDLSLNDFGCTWQNHLHAVEQQKRIQEESDAWHKQVVLRRKYLFRRWELAKDLFPEVLSITGEQHVFTPNVTFRILFKADILDAALETEQAEIADDLRSIMAWTKETNA